MVLDLTKLSMQNVILLNNISKDIQDEFNDLIEGIYIKTDKSIDWLVSSTLSRNPYLSDIYINVCYLLLIKKLLKEDDEIKTIIVPNCALKKVLVQYIKENDIRIEIICKKKNSECLKDIIRPLYGYTKAIYTFLHLWLLKSKKRRNKIQSNQEITLIDTFFLPSMFKTSKFKDRYYNGLLLNFSKEERNKIYFVPTVLIKNKLKQIIKISESAEENFIYKFDYLKLKDYLYALLSPLRIKRINFDQFIFHEFKIGQILRADFYKNISNGSSLTGILNYRFFERLKKNRIKLKLVINWFENQVIDRGFNKGIHDFYPKTYTIGYQGFIVSMDYNFYLQPSIYEALNGVIPDEIAVVGNRLKSQIKKFSKDLNVSVAPAFRFQGVWESTEIQNKVDKNIILIMLPLILKESIEIMQMVTETVKLVKFDNVEFQIKPHPALNIEKLKSNISRLPEDFKFIKGDFKDCVSKANIMLGNTSSTCLETLAIGIPVIIIGSQSGLTQNPIPENVNKDIWKICYTPKELSDAISHFINISNEERDSLGKIGEEIRAMYFEPVTREGVRKFLRLQ